MDRTETRPLANASLARVVEQALESAKDLAADEARLFLDEMEREQARAKWLAIMGAGACVLATAGLAWVGMALLLAAHAGWVGVLFVGMVALAMAGGLGLRAYRMLPEVTFEQTRARLAGRAKRVVAAAKEDPGSPMHIGLREGVER